MRREGRGGEGGRFSGNGDVKEVELWRLRRRVEKDGGEEIEVESSSGS